MHAPTVVASVLLSSVMALAITELAANDTPPVLPRERSVVAPTEDDLERLEQQVSALRREVDEARSALANLSPPRTEVRAPLPAVSKSAETDTTGNPPESAAAMFADLNGSNFFDNGAAWRRARRSGRMGELLAMFENAATIAPNDLSAQMALADAYLANVVMGVNQAELSRKADAQFDKVLAIDERHWRARFSKAMSYTFWPEVDGKKVEAIAHFEILMQQQESSPVEEQQAQVYLALGNVLSSTDIEEARAVWQRGARRHPDNSELRRKVQPR